MVITHLICHFKLVHKLNSRSTFPLTCYPLLIQGLHNDLDRGMSAGNGQFDAVLGVEGAMAEVAGMIRERFNMDGRDRSCLEVPVWNFHKSSI